MADFSALKAAIQAAIRQNGNNEITGNIMQGILLSIVNTLGDAAINQLADIVNQLNSRISDGYMYGGIATPTSTPAASSGKVFYIALQAGTYTHYGELTIQQGMTIIVTDNVAWEKSTIYILDDEPTAGSTNLAKSGGITSVYGDYRDSPEYIRVIADIAGRMLEATRVNGTKVLFGGMDIHGDIDFDGGSLFSATSPEWLCVMLDKAGRVLFGVKENGKFYADLDNIPAAVSEALQQIQQEIVSLQQSEASISERISLIEQLMYLADNPEFICMEIDSAGRVLAARSNDGRKKEFAGIDTPDANIGGHLIGNIDDVEERLDIELDEKGRIMSYRDKDGVRHECAGIETPTINGIPVSEFAKSEGASSMVSREYDLPRYGKIDIQKLISYTDGNNSYKPTDISKVGGLYYVTATLVDGQVTPDSVQVTLVESDIDITQWPADKSTKHYCKVLVDLGAYLAGTYYIEVKFQGDSTLSYPKKNFRFTFYKDEVWSKKLEVKIGELIPSKKYNLKAYWLDKVLMREPACYRIVQAIRETRDYNQQYPWNPDYNIFTGATGIAMNFPVRVDVSGSFYGINWFGLAKDINNFMLDDTTMNGVLVQGAGNANENTTFWHQVDTTCWDDILGDVDNTIGAASLPSVEAFFDYINSRNGNTFNRETAAQHMNIDNWIDSVIIFELFCCTDSLAKNFILYAGADKQVFSPMYYDMDYTFTNNNPEGSVLVQGLAQDKSIWRNFISLYWDEICVRYKELRKSIINEDYMMSFLQNLIRYIPYSDYRLELTKWSNHGTGTLADNIGWIRTRIAWLDIYFNN